MPHIAAVRPVSSRRTGILEQWAADTKRKLVLELVLAEVRDTISPLEYPTLSAMIQAALHNELELEKVRVM
jgi:hypothetical protein